MVHHRRSTFSFCLDQAGPLHPLIDMNGLMGEPRTNHREEVGNLFPSLEKAIFQSFLTLSPPPFLRGPSPLFLEV